MKETTKRRIEYDCIVVGGGAAGMMAAITLAAKDSQLRIAIVEHTSRIGTKLLQTGNGKCNFTNLVMNSQMYQNENTEFIQQVLTQFDVPSTLTFFKSIGVYYKEKNGYVYPNSETAASLQDALRMEIQAKEIPVILECEITDIIQENQGKYRICTNTGTIYAGAVILATGSAAAPKTGSDGSGYVLAKKLGHTVVKPLPALVQLVSDQGLCKIMSGVRSTGKIELYVDKKLVAQDIGEIQYTDYGISGIPVFQISRHAVSAVDLHKNVIAVIDLLPEYTKEELEQDMKKRKPHSQKTVEQFFSGLLNKKLVAAIAKMNGISPAIEVSKLSVEKLMLLIETMKCFEWRITGFKSFEHAQICQGGVSLQEINPDTMESRKKPGLFFAGELTDADGKCGGYNLQWAWSSGHVAGNGAYQYLKEETRHTW